MVGDRTQLLRDCWTQGFHSMLAVGRGLPSVLRHMGFSVRPFTSRQLVHQREQARSSEEEC